MSEKKYYLTLRDEDNEPTHICLFEKDDRQKQLELVEASALVELQAENEKHKDMASHYIALAANHSREVSKISAEYDSLKEKADKLRDAAFFLKKYYAIDTSVSEESKKFCEALKEYDQARGEG